MRGNQKPLYRAMRKYGVECFRIEVIDTAATAEELGEKERHYISLYNTISPNGYNLTAGGERCQLDGNPRTKLSVEDVVKIRDAYASCSVGIQEVHEQYKDRISYSAFEKIWEGTTWPCIHMDVYTAKNKEYHRTDSKSLSGESNGNALIQDSEILEARQYYMTHTLAETFAKYGSVYKTVDSFRSALTQGYYHLPIYHKRKQKWTLKNKIIDFTPVSTIPESGE